mmetsp:Transcript_3573/g.10763  ORF Transcript_3573/g.10763 Transcript_3573/m.10763 type:complete len:395 (+) Transcript_3573:80-1264(+)
MVRVLSLVHFAPLVLLLVASVTACGFYEHLKPQKLQKCEESDEFHVKLMRPDCLCECHLFDEAKNTIYERLQTASKCATERGLPFAAEGAVCHRFEELVRKYACARNEAVSGHRKVSQMCFCAPLVIELMNDVAASCLDGFAPEHVQKIEEKSGVLRCEAKNTIPFALEKSDGEKPWDHFEAFPEPPLPEGTDERIVKVVQKLVKRIRVNQWRLARAKSEAQLLGNRAHALFKAAKEAYSKNPLLALFLVKKAYLCAKRRSRFLSRSTKFEEKIVELKDKLHDVLDELKSNPATAAVRLSARHGAEFLVPAVRPPKLECVQSTGPSHPCEYHRWLSGVEINEQCFNVCVHRLCRDDLLLSQCLRVTVDMGVTLPTCHADGATRDICFPRTPIPL